MRDITELVNLQKELHFEKKRRALLQNSLLEESAGDNVICNSEEFKEVLALAKKVSRLRSNVLILGETGTGKEVVAQYIHRHSQNDASPFVKTNCGAISKYLLESELFGYAPGAFTGASPKGKMGLFELADNGTLFLDEVGELPLEIADRSVARAARWGTDPCRRHSGQKSECENHCRYKQRLGSHDGLR